MEIIESILQTESLNSKYIYLYLHKGLWKAYDRSAQILSLLMKNKGTHSVENLAPHRPCLDTYILTTESLIDSHLLETCLLVEDNRLVFNRDCAIISSSQKKEINQKVI